MTLHVFLILTSLHHFFGFCPSINGVGMCLTTNLSQSMRGGVFRMPDPPQLHSEWDGPVVGRMGSYDFVRGILVGLFSFHFFPFLQLTGDMQPRRSALNEGDNVTARHMTCRRLCNAMFI